VIGFAFGNLLGFRKLRSEIIGMGNVLILHFEEFRGRAAQDLAQFLVDAKPASVAIEVGYAHGCKLKGRAETFLACS
jgi:hypothetical protein